MIMGRCMGVVRLAMIVVAMTPKNQFFEDEKRHDAKQDGRRRPVYIAVFECMRQDFQKGRAEQCTDRIGDQHADAMRAEGETHRGCGEDAQGAASQRNGNDPGKSAHGNLLLGKGADYTPAGQFGLTASASSRSQRRNAATESRWATALRITRK